MTATPNACVSGPNLCSRKRMIAGCRATNHAVASIPRSMAFMSHSRVFDPRGPVFGHMLPVMGAAYIIDAVRTPIGRYGGALAEMRADDLLAVAIRGLLARQPIPT